MYNNENKTLKFNEDGKFKILMFSDLHSHGNFHGIGRAFYRNKMLNAMNALLDEVKPDFVMVGGDLCVGSFHSESMSREENMALTLKDMEEVLEPVISRNIPWAHVFGNHDAEAMFTKEEQETYDRYIAEDEKVFRGSYASECTYDDDGKLRHWKWVFPGIKIEVFPPEMPSFSLVVSWRARCSKCGAEHLIFDNQFHGYDGVFCTGQETCDYLPHYVQRAFRDKEPRRIEITTENDPTLEEFRENTGIQCEQGPYSNAFGWISAVAVDEKGKKTKLFDYETA